MDPKPEATANFRKLHRPVSMKVAGIDLSGPSNTTDTCLAIFQPQGDGLLLLHARQGVDDGQILETILGFDPGEGIVIGIDAPLSYQPGGGDRPADQELRRLVGGRGGVGVMTPTMTRMVYLTLRGVNLTRLLESLKPGKQPRIVEVHPGAVMLLRGAPREDVAGLKDDPRSRLRLLGWLGTKGLGNLPVDQDPGDHFVAACAAALGAWEWALGKSAWNHPAEPPLHPFDFAC